MDFFSDLLTYTHSLTHSLTYLPTLPTYLLTCLLTNAFRQMLSGADLGGFKISKVSRDPLEISQCRAVKIKIL